MTRNTQWLPTSITILCKILCNLGLTRINDSSTHYFQPLCQVQFCLKTLLYFLLLGTHIYGLWEDWIHNSMLTLQANPFSLLKQKQSPLIIPGHIISIQFHHHTLELLLFLTSFFLGVLAISCYCLRNYVKAKTLFSSCVMESLESPYSLTHE